MAGNTAEVSPRIKWRGSDDIMNVIEQDGIRRADTQSLSQKEIYSLKSTNNLFDRSQTSIVNNDYRHAFSNKGGLTGILTGARTLRKKQSNKTMSSTPQVRSRFSSRGRANQESEEQSKKQRSSIFNQTRASLQI